MGGDVNVHVNLRNMRMLRHVRGLGLGWAVSSCWHQNARIYTHVVACFPSFFHHEQAAVTSDSELHVVMYLRKSSIKFS